MERRDKGPIAYLFAGLSVLLALVSIGLAIRNRELSRRLAPVKLRPPCGCFGRV